MKLGTVVCAAAMVCLCGASSAWAQDERGFVRVLGGGTFGTANASPIFGGGVGVNVAPNIQLTGELGRIGNVLPSELEDNFDLLEDLLSIELGLPVSFDVKAPIVYVLGGVRFNVPAPGRVQPFVEGQVGVGTISFDIEAEVAGIDLSDEIQDEAGLENETELIVAFGGGVNLGFTETLGVDVGYRYGRIFTDDPAVNTNTVYAALTFKFR
jgi:opacity protein-like surface antigen